MKKIKQFASKMKKGLAIEARETIEIPKHIITTPMNLTNL